MALGLLIAPATQAATPTETALAVPRVAPLGSPSGAPLPQPLSPSDARLVREAFALEARGALAAADQVIGRLQNDLLLGQLEAARYLGRFHYATAPELTAWLQYYGDEPNAPAIRALLRRRLPAGARLPLPPGTVAGTRPDQIQPTARNETPQSAAPVLPSEVTAPRDTIIRVLFAQNRDARALAMAERMLHTGPATAASGQAAYVGGLAAWRMGEIAVARRLFANAAAAPYAPPQHVAAAAFWSARAAARQHDGIATQRWLHRAAAQPETLHGLLARALLGMRSGLPETDSVLAPADIDAIAALPGGWRAFGLLQVGQPARAAAELQGLWPQVQANPTMRHALILVAAGIGLTDCAWQLAARDGALASSNDAAILPLLRPANGFHVSPALIYAVARVESRFDPAAVSPAGARGLMQLMPATAHYLSGKRQLSLAALHNPAENLALGQRYMLYLAGQDAISGDLLRLLASYNDGPGGMARWEANIRDNGDPLLFIEAIPVDETRRFVQHALTYTWIYAARLRLPAPSLGEMAAGAFPRFTPLPEPGKIVEARLP